MKTGPMRHRVKIQQATETQTASGKVSRAWTDCGTVWAAVEPLTGREAVQAQQINPLLSHTVRIRYWDGLTTKYRFVFSGRTLNIGGIIDPDERHREMRCLCTEQL